MTPFWKSSSGGLLFLGPEPKGVDYGELQKHGISEVVSLLEAPRTSDGIASRSASRYGLHITQFPIRDGQIPESFEYVDEIIVHINGCLAQGQSVYLHCLAGLGRTGTIAGCFLVHDDIEINEIFKRLLNARGPMCPETEAQRSFIRAYVAHCEDQSSSS